MGSLLVLGLVIFITTVGSDSNNTIRPDCGVGVSGHDALHIKQDMNGKLAVPVWGFLFGA